MPGREPSRDARAASGVCLVFVTGPDRDALLALGRTLVRERLVACANVLGDARSVYRWEGEVQEAGEALSILKTTEARLEALTDRVRELHPYEEPEVIAVPVAGGSPSYLAWVADGVR